MQHDWEHIRLEHPADRVARIVLARPEAANAQDFRMLRELNEAFDAVKDSSRMMTDIRNWIRLALEAELKLEQRKKKERGIVHTYALDMDAARTSVGCRLDRLRRCCRAGRLPGQPD